MVNDAYLFFNDAFLSYFKWWCVFIFALFVLSNDDAFLSYFNDVFYLKALFSTPLIPIAPPSFPITFIHSFQTLKFLSNSKISFTFQKL